MTIFGVLFLIALIILFVVATIWIVGLIRKSFTTDAWLFITISWLIITIAPATVFFKQTIGLRQEQIRQTKEREQIIYQIEHLTDDKDKIKLNEWILTYNDWVNDVNTSKETYGWFSWYSNFDMTNHTVIDLV